MPVFNRDGNSEEDKDSVSNANADFPSFVARFSGNYLRRISKALAARLPRALIAAILGLAAVSCGTPGHATLQISAPASVVANVPFSATVTAIYEGRPDTVIDGPIHFTTSDKAAQLPTLYVFTAADQGSHTFTGLTLVTPGNQTMTVSDYDATPIAGTVNIMVTAPPPADR